MVKPAAEPQRPEHTEHEAVDVKKRQAVDEENFELAAELRDRLRTLE